MKVPWTAGRSNQSILKEINPEYSLEGLTLKLQYSGHLIQRTDSLEKTLMLGKIEGRRRRGRQRMRWLDGIINSVDVSFEQTPKDSRALLIAQLIKNPPVIQETLVLFLGQEVPLEKG